MKARTRFAPSPTGLLHVGNAFSALICRKWAESNGAELLLRIEDIDHSRCREEYAEQLLDDLNWLGIRFHGEPVRQSQRHQLYRAALERLDEMGVIYPCFCTRRHIQQEIERMGVAPHSEDHADPYPGICRIIDRHQSNERMESERFAWRLDVARAMDMIDSPVDWHDEHGRWHTASPIRFGDTVIGRKDIGFSYHLAVVVDDAEQGITHVIRGKDLYHVTAIHCLLQKLLGLPTPTYIHHELVTDREGKRLAKRNNATTLKSLREAGISAASLNRYLMRSEVPSWPFTSETPAEIRHLLEE